MEKRTCSWIGAAIWNERRKSVVMSRRMELTEDGAIEEQVRSVGELDERLRSDGRDVADDIERGSRALFFPHRTGLERGDHPE